MKASGIGWVGGAGAGAVLIGWGGGTVGCVLGVQRRAKRKNWSVDCKNAAPPGGHHIPSSGENPRSPAEAAEPTIPGGF